jgi:Protein of unknown function (DUF2442)
MAKRVPAQIPVRPMTPAMKRKALLSRKTAAPFDVVRARFNRTSDALELTLRNGMQLKFPRSTIRELAKLRRDIGKVEIQPGGDGISFRSIDVDISVPGLLADELKTLFVGPRQVAPKKKSTTKNQVGSRSSRQRKLLAA